MAMKESVARGARRGRGGLVLGLMLLALPLVFLAWWPHATRDGRTPIEPVVESPSGALAPAVGLTPGGAPKRVAVEIARSQSTESPPGVAPSTPTQEEASAAPQLSPLRFLLVDEAKGEPLSNFSMRVEGHVDGQELLVSDEAGRVESKLEYPLGSITLLALDYPECPDAWAKEIELDHVELEKLDPWTTLSIAVGRSFRIRLQGALATEVESLRAALGTPNQPGEPTLTPWNSCPLRGTIREPWVRFPAAIADRFQGRVQLTVVDQIASRSGSAEVPGEASPMDGPILVILESASSLRGRVLDRAGLPVESATVTASAVPRSAQSRVWNATSAVDGSFSIPGMDAGNYEVVVGSRLTEISVERLRVEAFEVTNHDFVLTRVTTGGDVRGTILGYSEAYEDSCSVTLREVKTRFARTAYPTKTVGPDGNPVWGFEFKDLPDKEFELTLDSKKPGYYQPERMLIHPPALNLEFKADETSTRDDYGLLIGPPPDDEGWAGIDFHIRRQDGRSVAKCGIQESMIVGVDFQEGAKFDWVATSEGFIPRVGDDGDFTLRDPNAPGGRHKLRGLYTSLKLKAGWGSVYLLSDGQGPLHGATAWIEGLQVGRSDRKGRLVVEADSAPTQIEFRFRGWEPVVDRNPQPGTPAPPEDSLGYKIRLGSTARE